jgi:aminoglycoside phosphotransferase (APT) family kinase protein
LLLEQERYPTPIVVLSWLDGTPCAQPPADDAEWQQLAELFATIHRVIPAQAPIDLPPPVLIMRSAAEGLECIRTQFRVIPEHDQPADARALLARLERHPFPAWDTPPIGLCQADGNFRNVIQRPGGWGAVDWEYSGWGEPAFEFASIRAHAAYLDVPLERWDWVQEQYLCRSSDPGAAERIGAYTTLMYGFWVGRFARMLYEIPRGGDQRLTPWPEGWLDATRVKYERYLALADAALRS